MAKNPVEQPTPPQALVIGVLSEGDIQDLQQWSAEQSQDDADYLSGMGKVALAAATEGDTKPQDTNRPLYGVYFSPAGGGDASSGRFIRLNGSDAGTQIGNNPDTFKRLGLPLGGPRAALEALKPTQMQGGLIHMYQPYEGIVKVRRNNGDIDDGWKVIGVTTDGTRATVFKEQAGKKTVSKLVPIEDINPIIVPIVEQSAPIDKAELARQQAEEQKKRLERMFSLPTADDLHDNKVADRMRVTERSVQDAALIYRFSETGVKEIFRKYKTEDLWREADMPELARTNDALRVELGTYLLNRLHTTSFGTKMPHRLRVDGYKAPNHYGFSYLNMKFTSSEWSTLIAVSMLDGTFKKSDVGSDKIVMYKDDYMKERMIGQHRYMAYQLLDIPKHVYVDQLEVKQAK